MTNRRQVATFWIVGIMGALLFCPPDARAQARDSADRVPQPIQWFVFGAPGLSSQRICGATEPITSRCLQPSFTPPETLLHAGGGIEWFASRSLGASVELGFLVQNGYFGGMFSANGSYHFRRPPGAFQSLVPFVTGGYSLHPDLMHGVGVGGGVTAWGRGGTGLRVEVRTNFWQSVRHLEFRVGVTFGPRQNR
jgi:hypothetical protein